MKIGIITPFDSANYGAFLQAYANKTYLERLGHEVVFVRWRSNRVRCKEFFEKPKTIKEAMRFVQRFPFLMKNYNCMTKVLGSVKTVEKSCMNDCGIECLVVGSDEIWNIKVSQYQQDIFYGSNEKNIPVIVYAPSSGQASVSDYEKFPWIMTHMSRLIFAGVRDENTKEIVESIIGVVPAIVSDPTLLVKLSDMPFDNSRKLQEKYLLVYSYSVPKEHRTFLKEYAKKNNLKLVALCMYQPWCDKNITCSPLEFNGYIDNAECVYTTTFHGSIFTLLNHKKCAIYAPSKKLRDLLEWTKKTDVMLPEEANYSDFESLLGVQTNYNEFEELITVRQRESHLHYNNVLNQINTIH